MLLGAFVAIELRSRAPLIRLGIFRIRSLTCANLCCWRSAPGMFANFFFATLYVQEILGYSRSRPVSRSCRSRSGIGIGAGLAQQLIKARRARSASVGMVLATGGFVLLAAARSTGRTSPICSRD